MQPTCDSSGLIPLETALEALLAQAIGVTETETVDLNSALGRVLAQDIESQIDVPPFNASAMDGYAINSADIGSDAPLPISQRIAAGQQPSAALAPGSVARIFTGAPLPEGADTVVMQEACDVANDLVTLAEEIEPGQFVRLKGSHVSQNSVILGRGTKLGAAEIGLAASTGINSMAVYRRLKVALLTTGDELIEPGLPLQPGQIYNANQYMLSNMLTALNCQVTSIGPVIDDAAAIKPALEQAAQSCDIIISSGGVSVGEEDHVKAVVEKLGKLDLWRIRIKPGKPLAFGNVLGKPFIGLPGNPVSSFVTFCLFARPFILKSQGLTQTAAKSFSVAADFELSKPDNRREYKRVSLVTNASGQMLAQPYRSQDSATLMSTSNSDGLLCVPEGVTFKRGEMLLFTPHSELLG